MYYKVTKKEFNEEVARAFATEHVLLDSDNAFMYYRIIDSNTEFYYNKSLLVYRNTLDNTYRFYYYSSASIVIVLATAKKVLAKKYKKKS